ncbi:MAG: HD domain-containing protein [Clostridia bacterium]|nr:HD domain-containing protein [Clostridia bacterium]
MTSAQILEKMIVYSKGCQRDIEHLMRVWGFARTIGCLEGLDESTLLTVETAAILHDIACPFLRAEMGCSPFDRQEELGAKLAKEFLSETDLPSAIQERVVFLVGHHHSPQLIDGIDFRILIEADYLVNCVSHRLDAEAALAFESRYFATETGRKLLHSFLPEN